MSQKDKNHTENMFVSITNWNQKLVIVFPAKKKYQATRISDV